MNRSRRVLIFACIVLPVLTVSLYGFVHSMSASRERIYEQRRAIASLSEHVLREKLDRISDLGLSFSTRPLVYRHMNEKNWDAAIDLMKKVPEDFPYITRVLITDTNGILRAETPRHMAGNAVNYSDADWYRNYSRTHSPYLSTVYCDTIAGRELISAYACPVRNDSGDMCGILVLQVDISKLLDWTPKVAVGSSGFLYVVDQKGNLAAHSHYPHLDSIMAYASVPAVQKALKGEANTELLYNPMDKEERLVAYEQVPGYHWVVVAAEGSQAALAATGAFGSISTFYLVTILLACCFALFIVQEMDRRKKAEKALQKSIDEIKDLYDKAPCGYLSVDSNIFLCNINQTLLQWTGYTSDEVIGKMKYEDLLSAESRAAHLNTFETVFADYLKNGYVNDLEYEFQRKDGSVFPALVNSIAVLDQNGNFASSRSTVFDNTERKKTEQQLKAVNKELESFSYSVSHDLRAPLRGIIGFTQILVEDYGKQLDEEANRLMGIIMANARKMGQLIDDLLDFSRLGRKEMSHTTVAMYDMVLKICEDAGKENMDRNIEFHIRELPNVQADPALMHQVWVNLISNAVKYSRLKEKSNVEIGFAEKGAETIFYIKDNGAGFDMRYADKLFGVFQRLHSDEHFEGTGVGLAIVQRIIVKHGGRVWADSKLNEGATFYFSIPHV